jgi:nitrogen fixation/metabolism regulation signal transduction histidine kinase
MRKARSNSLTAFGNAVATRSILDAVPCAVVLWNRDRTVSIANRYAREMFGFKAGELEADPSLWINSIHNEDRGLFRAAWKKLSAGEKRVSCDYRFHARGDKELWLRDISVCHGEREPISSVYVDVSDLRRERRKHREAALPEYLSEIIDTMVHGVRNDLQMISSRFDLMAVPRGSIACDDTLADCIQRISRTIVELREFFSPPEPKYSRASPKTILEELVRDTQAKLKRQNIDLRVRCDGAMPLVRLDWSEFRKVLAQIIEFSSFLLPDGGQLELKIAVQSTNGKHHVELQIICASATAIKVKESDIFRPFLNINGRQTGLGVALTRHIVERQDGDISFEKSSANKGLFTLSLKAS